MFSPKTWPFLIFLALVSGPTWAADTPPKPVELKVLEKFVGDWITEGNVTVLDAQPKNLKTTDTATRKWALDGRIVEESGKSSDGNEVKVIFTYDAVRKTHRSWFFSSSGISVDMAGPWDETTQSFSFRTDFGNGFTQIATIHFIDNDNQEWSSKVTDAGGKVYFDGGGKLKRTKK